MSSPGDRVYAQADGGGNVTYLLTDGHGSTQQLTNASGQVTAAFRGALGSTGRWGQRRTLDMTYMRHEYGVDPERADPERARMHHE